MPMKKPRPATFCPYLPAGAITADELVHLLDEMRAAGAKTVKLTGEMVFVWDVPDLPESVRENGRWHANSFKASAVRPVRTCSAEVFCRRYQQPVVALAKKIDERFKDTPLPRKMMIGVAGCQRSCSEPATKDIGIIGHPKGYELLAGGSAGLEPRIAKSLGIVSTMDGVLEVIGRVIAFLETRDEKARLGRIVEEAGVEEFKRMAGIASLLQ
ncbi:MAG: hypothetical protein HZA04_04380 [Nitrospinae bacterium]|nr:hypothetical protein [Nitrospinota bacterium]